MGPKLCCLVNHLVGMCLLEKSCSHITSLSLKLKLLLGIGVPMSACKVKVYTCMSVKAHIYKIQ